MSCSVDRFVITKGVENTFVFTIKADDSTLPLVIEIADTFNFQLVQLSAPETVALTGSLVIEDGPNGKVSWTVSQATADSLISDKGTKTDRYYLRPTYKLVLECSTVNNGDFLAKVSEVYVD
jgi:hypothetical protein